MPNTEFEPASVRKAMPSEFENAARRALRTSTTSKPLACASVPALTRFTSSSRTWFKIPFSTAFLTRLPDHALGELVLDAARGWGVDVSHIQRVAGGKLGLTYVELSAAPLALDWGRYRL